MKYKPYVTSAQILVGVSLGGIVYFAVLYARGGRLVDIYSMALLGFVCLLLVLHLRKKK